MAAAAAARDKACVWEESDDDGSARTEPYVEVRRRKLSNFSEMFSYSVREYITKL